MHVELIAITPVGDQKRRPANASHYDEGSAGSFWRLCDKRGNHDLLYTVFFLRPISERYKTTI